jgi:hypothetical protein
MASSTYNKCYECTCYHPLPPFNGEGDCLTAKLRPGKVHSAEDWAELLLPEIESQKKADGCMTKPDGKAAVRSLGTCVGAGGFLSRALGPAQKRKVRSNSLINAFIL